MRRWAWLLGALALASCEHRPPIGRAEAIADAESFQREKGLWWGSPIDIQPPQGPDRSGHRWWQLAYADGTEGPANRRVILVDGVSGWAELPGPDYLIRVPAIATATPGTQPVVVQDGPYILLVTTPAAVSRAQAERLDQEASRLNALAASHGLYPLFSLRTDDQGRSAVVYGWQGSHGIQRDTRVSSWLASHTADGAGTWVDLRP